MASTCVCGSVAGAASDSRQAKTQRSGAKPCPMDVFGCPSATGANAILSRPFRADRILLALARLEPPLSWLDWYHVEGDRAWIAQYRDKWRTDYYPMRVERVAELRQLGFIEPVVLDWNRDRYVLTPAGLWQVIQHGRPERRQVRLERLARGPERRIQPIRAYVPPSEWRKKGLGVPRANPDPSALSRPAGDTQGASMMTRSP